VNDRRSFEEFVGLGVMNSIPDANTVAFFREWLRKSGVIEHDSQMLPRLLDPENEHNYVWADSAYSGECFEDLLNLGGFESLIHKKGARNHPLCDAAKTMNRLKSAIRACRQHAFGCMPMSMGGRRTRKIGLERTESWWGLKKLTFNLLRYLQHSSHIILST
jgi:IS5 family transposase